MDAHRDRRGFLKDILGGAARAAKEVTPLGGMLDLGAPAEAEATPPETYEPFATVAPTPPARCLSLDELAALADELGLGARRDAIRGLARTSVQLAPGPLDVDLVTGATRLGGVPDLPDGVDWPTHAGSELAFLGQIDLAAVAALGAPATALPSRGLLSVFYDVAGGLLGTRTEPWGEVRVLLIDPDAPGLTARGPGGTEAATFGSRAALAPELVLPRVWALPVQSLELDGTEHDAWASLRLRLAEEQGVVPDDLSPDFQALHRLLGYPDETYGDMPLICEMAARGIELGEDPPSIHPQAEELEAETLRWRLLLQLTLDEDLGWMWGDGPERLYLWIDEADLAAADFSRVRAIPQ